MQRLVAVIVLCLTMSGIARAGLDVGESAPDFTVAAALGGKVYQYSLAEALRHGPVVLYFFPAAFSEGCSLEAHSFAEAVPQYEALGATVVGVSADGIEALTKFSVQSCQSRFPVASDENQAVMKAYDAVMHTRPDFANRVTYVIAPNGRITYEYMSLNPTRHVERTLEALRTMGKTKAP